MGSLWRSAAHLSFPCVCWLVDIVLAHVSMQTTLSLVSAWRFPAQLKRLDCASCPNLYSFPDVFHLPELRESRRQYSARELSVLRFFWNKPQIYDAPLPFDA